MIREQAYAIMMGVDVEQAGGGEHIAHCCRLHSSTIIKQGDNDVNSTLRVSVKVLRSEGQPPSASGADCRPLRAREAA